MDKQSKEIILKDAILKVRNEQLDKERCQICGEPSPVTISRFIVNGEEIESDESMCENCFDNVRSAISDMELKLQTEHCY